ncbi:MAG: putative amidohydrolase [Spirosomataceae bacterium]|jgi:predicted amidohydrolase
MSKKFAIGGIQMYVSALHSNVEVMKQKVEVMMSVYPWVQMIVFSELCAYGPLSRNAMPTPNNTEEEFKNLAKKHGIWLIPGTMFTNEGDEIYNTAMVINPTGEMVGRYHKMFPFYPYEQGIASGSEFMTFDVPEVGRFGMSICYDMWFPETSRTLAVHGVEVIIHPTLTGTIDRDIELVNVQATAAIQQCFVIDINGLGDGGNGRSIICGPDGRIIYQAGTADEMIPIEIDVERVHRSRELGVLRLGQPLKSFRDNKVLFDVYQKDQALPYLNTLGELKKHTQPGKDNLPRNPI